MPGHTLKSRAWWADDPMVIDINSFGLVIHGTICLQEPRPHPVDFEDVGTTHLVDNIITSIPTKC
eukprot:2423066-Prorocentrum_lima.AAC.1